MFLEGLRARLAARRSELHARRIVVLAGGASAEREVSLSSGRSVAEALGQAGHRPELIEIQPDNPLAFARSAPALPAATGSAAISELFLPATTDAAPPLVISMLHGADGENGTWQGLLELLDLPYCSAGVKGSAVAMDKALTKRLFEQLEVPTPRWAILESSAASHGAAARAELAGSSKTPAQLVAKPVSEGSSVGLLMFDNDDAGWTAATRQAEQFGQLLVEERITGRELTLSILGRGDEADALPLVEIRPGAGIYDYAHKYTAGASEYICPASLDAVLSQRIAADGLRAYRALELEPCARLDLLLQPDGSYFFLEANTLPGFTATSLMPKAALAAGIEYVELLELLLLCGLERWEARQPGRNR